MRSLKKIAVLLLAVILCFSMFTVFGCGDKTADSTEKVLTVGVKKQVESFSMFDDNGNGTGFEVDLMEEIVKLMPSYNKVKYVIVGEDDRQTMLNKGTVDAVIATFTITADREEYLDFSEPYFTDYVQFIVKNTTEMYKLEDLNGRTMGVLKNTNTQASVTAALSALDEPISLNYKEYDSTNYNVVYQGLLNGEIDIMGTDYSILKNFVTDDMRLIDGRVAPQPYGIAVKKSNTALATEIDTALASLNSSGAVRKLRAKWDVAVLDDYAGLKIGCLTDSSTKALIQSEIDNADVVEYATIALGVQALKNGDIEGFACDYPVLSIYEEGNLKFLNEKMQYDDYAVMVKKGNDTLTESVNSAIATIKASAVYNEMYVRWLSSDGSKQMPEIALSGTGTLKVGIFPVVPPCAYMSNEEYVGFDVEFAKRIAQNLGYAEIEIIPYTAIDSLFTAVDNGNVDIAISCLTATEERKTNFNVSNAYLAGDTVLLVKKG